MSRPNRVWMWDNPSLYAFGDIDGVDYLDLYKELLEDIGKEAEKTKVNRKKRMNVSLKEPTKKGLKYY